jgi:hypothetical protein
MMNMKHLLLLILLAFSGITAAAEKIGGYGIGYTSRLIFQKTDTQKTAESVMIKTGDILIPTQQANSNITPILVPAIKSDGWCYPAANPNKTTTDLTECYGWSVFSQWFLLDLRKLKAQGMTSVWAQISVKRYDDGDTETTDDDLVPAVTVWRGQQTQGKFGDWYPNQFQGFDAKGLAIANGFKPFWGWTLAPLSNISDAKNVFSWKTASTTDDKTSTTITQKIVLKGGDKDYLTVAIGGDSHITGDQHDVNFKLLVKLSTTKPLTDPAEPCVINCTPIPTPLPIGSLDRCFCTVGVTCSHPKMGHCMEISLCNLPQYKGQCLCPPADVMPCHY